MKRVTIVGPSGSGKSTLARQVGNLFHLPVFHMDQLFFDPGWVEKSKEELAELVESILESNDEWVIEGNYNRTLKSRLAHSTHLIILDYPRHLYVYRVIRRLFTSYGKVREDMAPGCPERIDLAFLKYVWNFKTKRRDKLLQTVQAHLPETCELTVFKNPTECELYFKTIQEKESNNYMG
ncbi:AAA family ATPase [Alkalibacterium pelagium]|uniref:Adenylate kinase n=1 Tax=Alkalibacterium pelagium TaxID=426702 RepID=A0A1H7IK45_9LACT|nr:AAA family ATPase [Alkalibacterium pelagium]GEN50100.1 topology modulation protein [Alkalibacterium pelagium]SEK62232.1 Adenylate kinase [Alkalibacterium pelagium]